MKGYQCVNNKFNRIMIYLGDYKALNSYPKDCHIVYKLHHYIQVLNNRPNKP